VAAAICSSHCSLTDGLWLSAAAATSCSRPEAGIAPRFHRDQIEFPGPTTYKVRGTDDGSHDLTRRALRGLRGECGGNAGLVEDLREKVAAIREGGGEAARRTAPSSSRMTRRSRAHRVVVGDGRPVDPRPSPRTSGPLRHSRASHRRSRWRRLPGELIHAMEAGAAVPVRGLQSGSQMTRRWSKGDSNSPSHPLNASFPMAAHMGPAHRFRFRVRLVLRAHKPLVIRAR
jgi:hypothetical protein